MGCSAFVCCWRPRRRVWRGRVAGATAPRPVGCPSTRRSVRVVGHRSARSTVHPGALRHKMPPVYSLHMCAHGLRTWPCTAGTVRPEPARRTPRVWSASRTVAVGCAPTRRLENGCTGAGTRPSFGGHVGSGEVLCVGLAHHRPDALSDGHADGPGLRREWVCVQRAPGAVEKG